MAAREPGQGAPHVDLSASDFNRLFRELVNWGRWDDRPEVGALHYLTADRIAAAAGLVRRGLTVSLGRTLNTQGGIDNPEPADHRMTLLTDVDVYEDG